MGDLLPALTLYPEWASLITWRDDSGALNSAGKRVENRPWACPVRLIGQDVAIHAGLRIGGVATVEQMRRWMAHGTTAISAVDAVDALNAAVRTAITAGGVVRLPRAARGLLDWLTPGHVVAVVRITGCDLDQRTPWDVPGQYHWRLDNVRALTEPVPCRGAQGIWRLPGEVDAAVCAQIEVIRG